MATKRPTILPLRDRPEPRRPYDLLPLADPTGIYPTTGELVVLCVLTMAIILLSLGLWA